MKKELLGLAALALIGAGQAAADEQSDLAAQTTNPLAALISVPIQVNYNSGIGPLEDGKQLLINVQPVIPISLNQDWNLISRTIVPIISQDDVFPGAGQQTGIGNVTQSLFLSPSRSSNGIVWGVGPVFLLPTATDDLLGPDKWGAGPTAAALWQGNGWTVGMLANHIWSFAGSSSDPNISASFIQPFISYTTPDLWTFSLNTEASYNWKTDNWSVPINASVSRLLLLGTQPVSLAAGVRYWAKSPDGVGPTGWGGRATMTFLFPK